jgi:hypothetical protein
MSFFDNARHSKFVKHMEKQENSSRFIGYFLDRLSVAGEPTLAQRSGTLIARSAASPMARAMLTAMTECESLAVRLTVLFLKAEPADQMAQWLEVAARNEAADPFLILRKAGPAALIDAHEQLVLGTTFSWQGDCMRRDPETRDAFETFECFNSEAARRAARTFQALWPKGDKLVAARRVPAALDTETLPAGVLNLTPSVPGVVGPSASTRH